MSEQIPAYAVGYLRDVVFGDDIIRYMREIDATLEPFGGEFIVHGGHIEAVEGEWDGALVIIRFRPTACQPWVGMSRRTISEFSLYAYRIRVRWRPSWTA